VITPTNNNPLLLYDGDCAICNRAVQWVLQHDRRAVFYFAPLQSELGKKQLSQHQLSYLQLDTLVLVANTKAYTHTNAVIEIGNQLGSIYRVFNILHIIPRFLRDAAYRYFAANRYKWFGYVDEQCIIPKAEWKNRFLE
jgi:predicted DCC family thiol-disulfide oxidoreductase YuxK